MRIVCVVSQAPGHLDFGGMGYIKLARALIAHGHEVEWISAWSQIGRLRKRNFTVHEKSTVVALKVNPFIPVEHVEANYHLYKERIHAVKSFATDLGKLAPDLIIFDRLVVYGTMVAEQLGIPYVCIGTPGGYWEHGGPYVQPMAGPVRAYHDLDERLLLDLKWRGYPQSSFWAHSSLLNICFTGMNFYSSIPTAPNTTAFVNNFDNSLIPESSVRVGISYGNSGHQPILGFLIKCIMENKLITEPTDVFVGNNQDTYVSLKQAFPNRNLHAHKWVDFTNYFTHLKYLIFYGGIGTIWHCVNHFLPMLIVPGLVGDQWINAESVSRLGLGDRLLLKEEDCALVASSIQNINQRSTYLEHIIAYRSASNFTDTMDSLCERLERLAGVSCSGS